MDQYFKKGACHNIAETLPAEPILSDKRLKGSLRYIMGRCSPNRYKPMRKPLFHLYGYCLAATLLVLSCASGPQFSSDPKQERQIEDLSQQVFNVLAGDIAMQSGDTTAAIHHYKDAAISSHNESLFANALAIAMRNELYDEATHIGKSWERINPNSLLLNQAMSIIYMRSDQPQKALPYIERIIANSVNFYRAGSALQDLLGLGLNPDMIANFVKADPDNPRLLLLRALFALNAQDYQSALQGSRDALAKDPSLIKAFALTADALFELGRVEESLELLETQSRSYPLDEHLLLKSARKHFLYDRDIKALASYQQFLYSHGQPLSPPLAYEEAADSIEATYAIATINLKMHQYQKARTLFTHLQHYALAIGNPPETQRSTYYLGKVDEAQGKYQDAIARYKSIGNHNLFSESRIAIARALIKQGKYQQVPQVFNEARRQTTHDRTRMALFIAQAEIMKDFASQQQVLQVYANALKQYPNELNILYSRAMFYNDRKDFASTQEGLKKIIKFDARNWRALNALGYLLVESNRNLSEAKEYLQRAYALKPNSAAVVDSVGWLEFRLNNLEQAEEYIRRAAGMHLHPEILGHLAEVFLSQNKTREALGVLERALSLFPDNPYLIKLYEAERDI